MDNKWKQTTLGSILDLNYGKGLTAANRKEGNIPVYSSAGITGYNDEPLAKQAGIIVGRKGTVGTVYYSPVPFFCIDTAYYFTEEDTKQDLLYLYYLLTYLPLDKMNTDSAVPGLNRNNAYSLAIDLPPLPVQRRIAAILSSLDDKIENNRKTCEKLEEIAQVIFKRWFVEFGPWGGDKPNDWLEKELGEVTDISAGGDKPIICTAVPTPECSVPVFSNGVSNLGLYGYTNQPKVTEESVTVSARGTIGFVCLRQEPFVPIVRLITVRPNSAILTAKYLYLLLSSIHIAGVGTTQQQLTVPNFKKYLILVPNKDAIKQFSQAVDPIFDTIRHKRIENIHISETRDALLPKLMSGELEVDDIEEVM